MFHRSAPKSVIKRLPIYLRILDNLVDRDVGIISSRELSSESGFTAEQIRKDLTYFGAFGTRGTGYNTEFLRDKILKIIGLDQRTDVVIIGAGHLGIALARYNSSKNPYVHIRGLFDNDSRIIGQKIGRIEVLPYEDAPAIIRDHHIKVAMLTVPAEAAQQVVEEIVRHGIIAILNFAPAKLRVPEGVHVHNADLTIELQSLIYYSTAAGKRLARLQRKRELEQEK